MTAWPVPLFANSGILRVGPEKRIAINKVAGVELESVKTWQGIR